MAVYYPITFDSDKWRFDDTRMVDFAMDKIATDYSFDSDDGSWTFDSTTVPTFDYLGARDNYIYVEWADTQGNASSQYAKIIDLQGNASNTYLEQVDLSGVAASAIVNTFDLQGHVTNNITVNVDTWALNWIYLPEGTSFALKAGEDVAYFPEYFGSLDSTLSLYQAQETSTGVHKQGYTPLNSDKTLTLRLRLSPESKEELEIFFEDVADGMAVQFQIFDNVDGYTVIEARFNTDSLQYVERNGMFDVTIPLMEVTA
jgi:hypothetical protein